MDDNQGIQLPDIKSTLARRGPVAAWVAGGVFLLAILVASLLPNRFEASSTLLIEPQAISKRFVEGGREESAVNDRLHLMTSEILSRSRLSRVIDDLGLYPDESDKFTREEVISLMREDIRVEPVVPEMDTSLIRRHEFEILTFRISFLADDAKTSATVANRLASDFVNEHLKERVEISEDTTEFVKRELARLTNRIQIVEEQIAATKAENPGRLPEDLESNRRILERSVDNLRLARRDLEIALSDEAFYKQQAITDTNIRSYVDESSPARRLQLLEFQLGEYESRGFTEKHPDIIATRQEIEALRKEVDVDGDGDVLSPVQANARAEANRAGIRAAGAREDIARIQNQIAEYEARILDTPRVAERLSVLEREVENLSLSYREFSAKQLEAEVAKEMELGQKGEQFRILEEAVPPLEPSAPNRPLILALGLFLGLAAGGGIAMLAFGSLASEASGRAQLPRGREERSRWMGMFAHRPRGPSVPDSIVQPSQAELLPDLETLTAGQFQTAPQASGCPMGSIPIGIPLGKVEIHRIAAHARRRAQRIVLPAAVEHRSIGIRLTDQA